MLMGIARRCGWAALFAVTVGCSPPAERSTADEEGAARAAFGALQAALQARDADKLWDLLDSDSQADANRAAKAVQEAHAKAGAEEKAKQVKALGLPSDELAKLTGKGYLKTDLFQEELYKEIPGSKIDKVAVQGDRATVNYTEPDGDAEKLTLVRQEGKWKVSLPIPKAPAP